MRSEAPPELVTHKVVVQAHPIFGRSAFATVPIAAGELVLCEEPLLAWSSADAAAKRAVGGVLAAVQQQLRSHPSPEAARIHADDWESTVGIYLSFCRAPEALQQQVLREMQSSGLEDAAPVRRSRIQAGVLAALAPRIAALLEEADSEAAAGGSGSGSGAVSSDAELIQRVLLAAELNGHAAGQDM